MGIYKVSCEYYVKADDKERVLEGIGDEGADLVESHIMINEVNEVPENEGIWRDYTKEYVEDSLEENEKSISGESFQESQDAKEEKQ